MQYGLIGEKLGHSFSKEIHKRIAPYPYELKEVAPQDLATFMTEATFDAINVTIPYKTAVIPYLAHVDPRAAAIGAVNTVVKREGKLYGYNTDYFGMEYLATSAQIPLTGERVLILGSGGTSRTAKALCEDLGAARVCRVGRVAKEGVVDYATAYDTLTDTTVIINTTPVGMYPMCDGIPIDLDRFPHLKGVLDVVYNPLTTKLVLEAKKRGIPATSGLPMLVAQAVAAAELFLDTPISRNVLEETVAYMTREKAHLILIGMPGCGKSSVGSLVAQKLGRPCIDIDEEIVRVVGCDIPTIFKTYGEEYFRDLESRVLKEVLYHQRGAVICTGGGVPVREENRDVLHSTGVVYWLDRSLAHLCPTEDRPTASTYEAMRARYEERYPIYQATAHHRIDGDGTIEEVANAIIEEFCK